MRKRVETVHKHNLRVLKQKKKNPNRKGNKTAGFLEPRPPSRELCKFLGWNPEEWVSRTSVHSEICKYVREKGLKSDKPGMIAPDAKLRTLFKTDQEFRHCDIQTFLCAHFPNKEEMDKIKATAEK
jgi:chromatin remodeling complex protein RSC6